MRNTLPVSFPVKSEAALMAAQVLLVSSCAQAVLRPSAPPGTDYYDGYMDGLKAAEARSEGGCFCGSGAVYALASRDIITPPLDQLRGRSEEYSAGFTCAYTERTKQKRQRSALVAAGGCVLTGGGCIAAAVLLWSLFSAMFVPIGP